MQDVRLHEVERRLQRIEHPDTSKVLVETAIILAVELAFTVGAPWLAGPVFCLIGSRLLARSSRVSTRAARRLAAARRYRGIGLDSLEDELVRAREGLAEATGRLRTASSPYQPLPTARLVDDMSHASADVRAAETARDLAGLSLADLEDGLAAFRQAGG